MGKIRVFLVSRAFSTKPWTSRVDLERGSIEMNRQLKSLFHFNIGTTHPELTHFFLQILNFYFPNILLWHFWRFTIQRPIQDVLCVKIKYLNFQEILDTLLIRFSHFQQMSFYFLILVLTLVVTFWDYFWR